MPTKLVFSASKYLEQMSRFHKKLGVLAEETLKEWALKNDGKPITMHNKKHHFCGKYTVNLEWCIPASDWVMYEEATLKGESK